MPIYKSKRGENTRIPGYPVNIHDVNYSSGEVISPEPITEVDFGTIPIVSGDNESAEKCIIVKSVDNKAKINNLKCYMIKGSLPGISVVADSSLSALVDELTTAGTPVAYSTKIAGNIVDADSISFDSVTSGESNRIRMQLQIIQSEFGTALPYDSNKELSEYYGEIFFAFVDSDYIIRLETPQAPFSSKLLSELGAVGVFLIDDDDNAISLGYLEPGVNINRSHNTIKSQKGYPKTTTEEIIESTDNSVSFTLQVEDWAITKVFDTSSIAYNDSSKLFEERIDDNETQLVERRIQLVGFTSGGFLRIYDFPRAKLKRAGEKSIHMTNTTIPLEITPVAEADGTNYKKYMSPNECHMFSIPFKMSVTVA
jgi:hypothetical protein